MTPTTKPKQLTYTDRYNLLFLTDTGRIVHREAVEGRMSDALSHVYVNLHGAATLYGSDTPNPYYGATVGVVYSEYGTPLVTLGNPGPAFIRWDDLPVKATPDTDTETDPIVQAPEPTPAQAPDLPTFNCYKCGQPVTPFTGDFDAPNLGYFDGTHAMPTHDICPPPPPPVGFDNKPLSANLRRATDHIGRGTGAA